MRLWPLVIIERLPRQQLLGQHRECCALRGLGWGRKHSTVDYVFTHPFHYLYVYHMKVMSEMERRGYNVDQDWKDMAFRGNIIGFDDSEFTEPCTIDEWRIYPEHDDAYLDECLENLHSKGVKIAKQ